MAPLITLLSTFAIASLALRHRPNPGRAGRLALAAMLVLTGAAHFTRTAELAAMVPPPLPWPVAVIYLTGVLELGFAVLLAGRSRPWLGWTLALMFLALLPANVYASISGVGMGGHGVAYLWFRVPLQGLFIAWALVSTGAVKAPLLLRLRQS